MRRFEPSEFYVTSRNPSILHNEHNLVVKMRPKGMELISQYYFRKYGSIITVAKRRPIPGFENTLLYQALTDFVASDITSYIAYCRRKNPKGDYRHAFLLGAGDTHATPLIYIRENGLECILLAQSKGVNEWAARTASQSVKFPVYTVAMPRQADDTSCYTDAMVFCKDATAKNSNTGEYYIPSLLTNLSSRAEEKTGYFTTKLPNELLKTAQISAFIVEHREAKTSEKVIHKNETLEQFRARYTDHNIKIRKKTPETVITTDIASYARQKALKFANTIEIQFYLNELADHLGDLLTDDKRMEFMMESKRILKNQGPPGANRSGLHEFAESFLAQHTSNLVDSADPPRQKY